MRRPRLSRARGVDAGWTAVSRHGFHFASAGLVLGLLLGVLAFAPASWLTSYVNDASDGRLLLADARGTVWTGSAIPVLGGGPGSRDATLLPGRLRWKIRLAAGGIGALELRLVHDCCLAGEQRLRVEPGLGRMRVALPSGRNTVGHWPAGWLSGLGTPWNTLKLGGTLQLASDGLALESAQGRWRLVGSAQLDLLDLSSRISPLDVLGSYRLAIGAAAGGGEGAAVTLATLGGALQMAGSGQWNGRQLRFRGEARAQPGSEAVLNNLLNLLGRRQGSLALLSIG